MNKRALIKHLDSILKQYDFRRKGNNWLFEGEKLIKIVNLQRSNFGNFYYINYGFIIKNLELSGFRMHFENRFGSLNKEENQRIVELLNFEKKIDEQKREAELAEFIDKYMLTVLVHINTEDDLARLLRRKPHLNDVPLVVKRYFNLQ